MHWFTCIFFALVVFEKPAEGKEIHYVNTWLPINFRQTGGGPAMQDGMAVYTDYISWFYKNEYLTVFGKYIHVFYAVLSASFGGGIGPVTIT